MGGNLAQDAPRPAQTGSRWRKAGVIACASVAILTAMVVLGLFVLDTRPGHRLLTALISRAQPGNGLRIEVGEIDGSIYRRATVKGVVLRDLDGVFLTAPAVTLDWRAAALLSKHLDIRLLDAPTVSLLRKPHFKATPPKPFTLPDLQISVGRLSIGRLVLEPPVTGERRVLTAAVNAVVGGGRVRLKANAQTVDLSDRSGGDRLVVDIDATPKANRLTIIADLAAPGGGVVNRLAHLGGDLTAHIGGRGDWRDWRGKLNATFDGRALVTSDLAAQSGLIRLNGHADPGLVLKGPLARLTDPSLEFGLKWRMYDRVADGSVTVHSAAMAINANGKLNLAKGAFDKLQVDATLAKPAALAPEMVGRDVKLALLLDGPFAKPLIEYDLQAASLGYGAYIAQTLHAAGRAKSGRAGEIKLPVHVTIARLAGFDPPLDALGAHIKLDGDLLISATRIASDNLRLRSDHIDAALVMDAALDSGRYSGSLNGKLSRFHAPGVGVIDLVTDAKMTPTGRGQFAIAGHVRATTSQVDNATLQDFLGGTAVLSGALGRSSSGVLRVDRLQLAAPKFKVLDGHGTYDPGGGLSFSARAVSERYGSAELTVTGTAKAPTAHLTSDRLGVGVPLTGVAASLMPQEGGFSIMAAAQSPYGPLRIEAGLLTAERPLVIVVQRASLDQIVARGRLTQTAGGPFAGVLQISGGGVSGPIRLAAAGKAQRLDATLEANNARLPLTPPITVRHAHLDATGLLGAGAPTLTATATASGVRRVDLTLSAARLQLDYKAGHGTATLTAAGATSAPFTLALSSAFNPQLIRVDGSGSIKGQTLRLTQPAFIRKTADGYRLDPATLMLPRGALRVSGTYGNGAALDLQVTGVDLGLANAFNADLLIGGTADGIVSLSLPARSGAGPAGRLRLQISNFTRSSLNSVSEPVDVALLGTLADTEGNLSAVVRRRGAVIGRSQLQLKAAAGGDDWLQRFEAARLSGGVRYNGPAEALWALSGVSEQQLSGPLAIGADLSGRLDAPQLHGIVSSKALRYENARFGTVITALAIDGGFTDTRFDLRSITGRTPGAGTISGSGTVDLSSAKGFPIDLKFALQHAAIARGDGLDATVSGTLAVTNSRQAGALFSGDLSVDEARYAIANSAAAEVSELSGVRRKGEPLRPVAAPAADTGPPSLWELDVKVRADNQVFVSGLGLDAEWRSDLRIRGDVNHPVIVGDVRLVRGTYSFAGRRLALSHGTIHLDGSSPPNPTLDLEASSVVDGVAATINIGGTATRPQITFTSSPGLPQDEVLSRLLFGNSVAQISPVQAVQLAASLNALRGSSNGLNPLGKLRQASSLDSLRFSGADQATGRGPAVGAGRYLGNNIYVEITSDARGFTATQIEIALTKSLRLLSQVSSFGGSNVSLEYSKDY